MIGIGDQVQFPWLPIYLECAVPQDGLHSTCERLRIIPPTTRILTSRLRLPAGSEVPLRPGFPFGLILVLTTSRTAPIALPTPLRMRPSIFSALPSVSRCRSPSSFAGLFLDCSSRLL